MSQKTGEVCVCGVEVRENLTFFFYSIRLSSFIILCSAFGLALLGVLLGSDRE